MSSLLSLKLFNTVLLEELFQNCGPAACHETSVKCRMSETFTASKCRHLNESFLDRPITLKMYESMSFFAPDPLGHLTDRLGFSFIALKTFIFCCHPSETPPRNPPPAIMRRLYSRRFPHTTAC